LRREFYQVQQRKTEQEVEGGKSLDSLLRVGGRTSVTSAARRGKRRGMERIVIRRLTVRAWATSPANWKTF
jgi:hypothetical protein